MKPVVIKEEEEGTDPHIPPDVLPNLPPFHSLVKVNTLSIDRHMYILILPL